MALLEVLFNCHYSWVAATVVEHFHLRCLAKSDIMSICKLKYNDEIGVQNSCLLKALKQLARLESLIGLLGL